MKRNGRLHAGGNLAGLIIMALSLEGCVSLQIPDQTGRPRVFGFGYAKSIGGANGQVYQIVAPGLSLRTGSAAPGLSLGWHETRLFFPVRPGMTNTPSRPAAIQTRCVGLELAPFHLLAGVENKFAIPLPDRGINIIQRLAYSEDHPTNTIVERMEIK